ncbi:SlyX family protein [Glaciecola sp. XM2]|jgi:SlyX protein|uniref:SlyX family protein n=1 Tax=Glaciecola sp. XM2 TaxID=1914931 RepID=UPI001BDF618A|nr:SlyX family protein [Glaciecola sp. XM2]MBT1451429.1 SlyX family protein [Glaciecola sp. XM2]
MSNADLQELKNEIESLQIKVAYQEDTIDQLNQVVTGQQKQLQDCQSLLAKVIEKVQTMQVSDNQGSDDVELPPHY